MAELFHSEETLEKKQKIYWDRQQFKSFEHQLKAVKDSSMVYVGNLSVFTTESQITETFSRAGPVKRVIMGLNSMKKTPCGFCFVEYYKSEHALNCLKFISNTVCDDQIIRCELDAGFIPGRQYGRGKSGGQVRDDRRVDIDPNRGSLLKYEREATATRTSSTGYKILPKVVSTATTVLTIPASIDLSLNNNIEPTTSINNTASVSGSVSVSNPAKNKRGRDEDEVEQQTEEMIEN